MKKIKKYMIVIIGFMMIGIGCAFTLKASIGVGAWDALSQTGYDIFKIKAGTISILLNCVCVIGEILILRKDFKKIQLLQIPCNIVLGYMINLVLYSGLSAINIENYILNVMLFIFGTAWNAFFVAVIMYMDVVTTALEGLCMAITRLIPVEFHKIRQGIDIITIIIIILLVLVMNIPSSIREGTVISMIIFGPLLGVFMRLVKKFDYLKL